MGISGKAAASSTIALWPQLQQPSYKPTNMRIALATSADLPALDPDDAPLVATLQRAGVDVHIVPWSDGVAGFVDRTNLAVVRTTWDYTAQVTRFLQWGDEVAQRVPLENKPSVLRWNAYKRYLTSLPRSVHVVPTRLLWRATTTADNTLEQLANLQASHVVVKPEVGAGGYDTRVFNVDTERDALLAFVLEQTKQRDMMLQPLQPRIRTTGETSLVFIDGELLLAINKRVGDAPGGNEFRIQERFGGLYRAVTATEKQLRFAHHLLETVGGDPLIARVDMVDDEHDQPQLMELELIEPSLFLTVGDVSPSAMARVAEAFVKRCR
jgi:hypothetical protein